MYGGFRKLGLNVDLVDEECSLEGYKVLAISMGYVFREGFAEKSQSLCRKWWNTHYYVLERYCR